MPEQTTMDPHAYPKPPLVAAPETRSVNSVNEPQLEACNAMIETVSLRCDALPYLQYSRPSTKSDPGPRTRVAPLAPDRRHP